jgi:hypothetical protein
VHDEEVAVTSFDANAKFLRLVKTLLLTPDSSIRERFGSFATLPAIDLETNSTDDAASPHQKLIGRCQPSGSGVSTLAAGDHETSSADLCAIILPHHRAMLRRTESITVF